MAKKEKNTLMTQYREILAKDGIRMEDCEFLCFAFKDERIPAIFHFDLSLSRPRVSYHLFDTNGKNITVILDKWDKVGQKEVCELAAYHDGKRITPNLV